MNGPAMHDGEGAPWERFAAGVMGTSHRAHLRLAYESLRRHDAITVLPHVLDALRARLAALGAVDAANDEHGEPRHDASTELHVTLTALWLLVVQERMARCGGDGFEAFLAANEDLLDARGLPLRYYHAATLADPLARRTFVLPDRFAPPHGGAHPRAE